MWGLFGHFPLSGQIFYVFYYYYVCLPQLIWNSFTCHKHVPGKPGLVCTQARPTWVATGLVPTPLSKKLGPSAAGSIPTLLAQPTTLQTLYHEGSPIQLYQKLYSYQALNPSPQPSHFVFDLGDAWSQKPLIHYQ